MWAFPYPLPNTWKTLTPQYKTDFKKIKGIKWVCFSCYQHFPNSETICCFLPHPKEMCSACDWKNDIICHKSVSSSLQWLHVLQLQSSFFPCATPCFFYTPTLFPCSFSSTFLPQFVLSCTIVCILIFTHPSLCFQPPALSFPFYAFFFKKRKKN